MTVVYLVAGEESGDVLGARLMAALRAERPDITFIGLGGARMEALGLASLFPMRELAVMGLLEVLPKLWRLRARLHQTAADVLARRPDVLVTIDSPGFTLRLLGLLRESGIRRVHYVAPQVWAWKEKRVRRFPGLWDRLLCLLPFEPAYFAKHGLAAGFVGHPVLESGADRGDGARFRAAHGLGADVPVLVMMPGSRRNEVGQLLGVFGATVARLRAQVPGLAVVVPVAATVAETVRRAVAHWAVAPIVVSDTTGKYDAFAAAGAALTKSGTSTLELAMAGVPMAVTYRVNPLTAFMARRLIKVPHVAMVNILAGREVVAELLQEQCRPDVLADAVVRLLGDAGARAAQLAALAPVLASLRPGDGVAPSVAAAREIFK